MQRIVWRDAPMAAVRKRDPQVLAEVRPLNRASRLELHTERLTRDVGEGWATLSQVARHVHLLPEGVDDAVNILLARQRLSCNNITHRAERLGVCRLRIGADEVLAYGRLGVASEPLRGVRQPELVVLRRLSVNLSIVFVALLKVEEQTWLVSFLDYDLGFFDTEKGRVEPAPDPFVPDRLLTICPE